MITFNVTYFPSIVEEYKYQIDPSELPEEYQHIKAEDISEIVIRWNEMTLELENGDSIDLNFELGLAELIHKEDDGDTDAFKWPDIHGVRDED